MPSVFLSHSSVDKVFAYRLATDLLTLGFSVWIDAWELSVGDSLLERLVQGIEGSAYVLLLMSPDSILSPWVAKEIEVALEVERRRRETVVLPLLIAQCDVPAALGDKIHLDFSSYQAALERLERRLKQHAASEPPAKAEQYRIPLVLIRGLFLDKTAFEASIRTLGKIAPPDFKVKPDQIFVAPDANYESLRNYVLRVIEQYPGQAGYDDEFYQSLRETFADVRRLEQLTPEGVALILSWTESGDPIDPALSAEAVYWFCRIMRNRILYSLRLFAFGHPPIPGLSLDPSLDSYGEGCTALNSDAEIKQVYALKTEEGITRFDLFDAKGRSVPFYVPSKWARSMGYFDLGFVHQEPAITAILPHLLYKFVVPQITYYHLTARYHYFGSLRGLRVGLS